jgi:hypothetical protein
VLWPSLSLSEQELEHVNYYRSGDRPGVRLRIYPVDLQFVQGIPGKQTNLTGIYKPSGRYTRVFALTASGALPYFRMSLSTNPGEEIIEMSGVAALFGLQASGAAFVGSQTAFGLPGLNLLAQQPDGPLGFEPNILLPGATNLIVHGEMEPNFIDNLEPEDIARAVLHLAFHVWEFPDTLAYLRSPKRVNANVAQNAAAGARTGRKIG